MISIRIDKRHLYQNERKRPSDLSLINLKPIVSFQQTTQSN